MFAQAKRDLVGGRDDASDAIAKKSKPGKDDAQGKKNEAKPSPVTNKRVTPSKNRPEPSGSGKGRPTPTRKEAEAARAKSARPKSAKKKR